MGFDNLKGLALFRGVDLVSPESWDPASGAFPVFESGFAYPGSIEAEFLFHGEPYRSIYLTEEEVRLVAGASRLPVRQVIGLAPHETVEFILKAQAYANWAPVSRFCPACGNTLVDGEEGESRGARVCASCSRNYFPRISPAIIVLVSRGNEMLLAHNVKFPTGRHGLVAGFVEAGETLEDTVAREVEEEAGIAIGKPSYVMSQPWPFPDSLMLAFEAEYVSGELRPDGVEIDHLGWFSADGLPEIPPPGSVARFLIDRFLKAHPAR
jgi:NAD+ diphosphatase